MSLLKKLLQNSPHQYTQVLPEPSFGLNEAIFTLYTIALDELAEFMNGCILIVLEIGCSKNIGLFIFLLSHKQKKLNKQSDTLWFKSCLAIFSFIGFGLMCGSFE